MDLRTRYARELEVELLAERICLQLGAFSNHELDAGKHPWMRHSLTAPCPEPVPHPPCVASHPCGLLPPPPRLPSPPSPYLSDPCGQLSYYVVDELMWLGISDLINSLRRRLKLKRIRPYHVPHYAIPHGYIWSPSLAEKPAGAPQLPPAATIRPCCWRLATPSAALSVSAEVLPLPSLSASTCSWRSAKPHSSWELKVSLCQVRSSCQSRLRGPSCVALLRRGSLQEVSATLYRAVCAPCLWCRLGHARGRRGVLLPGPGLRLPTAQRPAGLPQRT